MKVFLLCQRGNEREFCRAECKEASRCLTCEILRCAQDDRRRGRGRVVLIQLPLFSDGTHG